MKNLSAFLAGALFSVGLTISGMTDPQNVIGFLDISGQWNPSLMLVFCSAVIVTGIGYRLVLKRQAPVFEAQFSVPTNRVLDGRLMTGSAIFGIGWGLVGLCPGPALSSISAGDSGVYIFLIAMVGGMLLQRNVSAFIDAQNNPVVSA